MSTELTEYEREQIARSTYQTSDVVKQRREEAAAINAAMNPIPAGKMSDVQLGEIGAEFTKKTYYERAVTIIHDHTSGGDGKLTYSDARVDYPYTEWARTAFASAVREAVEKDQAEEKGRLFAENDSQDLRIFQLNEVVASRDEEISRLTAELDTQKAEASKWEQHAKNWKDGDENKTSNAALIERLAKANAELERLRGKILPRPVSIQPTSADADHHGRVLLIGPGKISTQALWSPWDVHKSWTHWLPCNLNAYGIEPPSAEEVERVEFEAAKESIPEFGNLWPRGVPMNNEAALDDLRAKVDQIGLKVWQAARFSKEKEKEELEKMLAACIPGGQSCDPQEVADNLRRWQSARESKEVQA